jgi:hypothetical protein
VEQPDGGGAVIGAQAFLLAGHVIVNVEAAAVLAFVESVSLSHDCIHSEEVTTIDLDSGRERVRVMRSRPELNPVQPVLANLLALTVGSVPNHCNYAV